MYQTKKLFQCTYIKLSEKQQLGLARRFLKYSEIQGEKKKWQT